MATMFGGFAPQGGMFGQQPGGLLAQLLGGGASQGQSWSPDELALMQQMGRLPQFGGFMPGIEGEGLSPDPYAKTYPEQYNATPGRVPGTLDQMLQGMPPPQNPGVAGAYNGLPPEILRMLLAPRQT